MPRRCRIATLPEPYRCLSGHPDLASIHEGNVGAGVFAGH